MSSAMSAIATFIWITHLFVLFKESKAMFQGDDPCLSPYKRINDFRRSVSYKLNHENHNTLCDSFLDEGWYRVTSSTGERMPTECVQFGSCGTQFGIWMKGNYPRENQTVVRDAYVSGLLSCEDKFYTIKIRNCWNAFHLYWLVKTSACPEAYCFGKEIPCPAGTSSETGLTPSCEEYPKENVTLEVKSDLIYRNETNSKNHTITHVPEIIFMCLIVHNFSDSLYYDVEWYINGDFVVRIKNQFMEKSSVASNLREEHWINKYRLNMMVKCLVRLRYKINGAPSPQTFSSDFEAGIKIENGEYSVKEAETISIPLWITIPFGCRWTSSIKDEREEVNVGFPNDSCELHLKVSFKEHASNLPETENILMKKRNCVIKLTAERWKEIHYVNISGSIDFKYNAAPRVSNLSILPYVVPHKAWENVQTSNIMVITEDSERELSTYMCKVLTGLHFITFDGSVLKWKTVGEYILYENKKFGVQVNIRIQNCRFFTRQLCICGLAIRNKDDYVLINFCSAKYDDVESCEHNILMIRGICSNNLTSISRLEDAYKIILLSGTEVIFERSEHSIWYVQIKPSSYDRKSTRGLCGYFSGLRKDDLIVADSNEAATSTDVFFKSWWVMGNRSLFNLTNLQDRNVSFDLPTNCRCSSDLSESCCGHFVRGNILDSHEVRDVIVNGSCDEDGHLISVDPSSIETFDLINEDINAVSHIQDGPWRNGWNQALAKYACEKSLLEKNYSIACKENIPYIKQSHYYDICVHFIESSGGKDLIFIVQSALFTECLFEALRTDRGEDNKNLSSTDIVQNNTQVLFESRCHSSCSGHGQCVLGKCVCEQEYTGTECLEKRTMSPLFTQCRKTLICDSKKSSCKRFLVSGTSFDEAYITCKIDAEKILVDNTSTENISSVDTYVTIGQAVNNNYGICNVQVPTSNEAVEYTISVSNRNHSVFNVGIKILIFNSDCFQCNSTLMSCETKASCILKLLPSDKKEQNTDDKFSPGLIISLPILLVMTLIIVPTTVACFRRYRRDKYYESAPTPRSEKSYATLRRLAQEEHNEEHSQSEEINRSSDVYDEIPDNITINNMVEMFFDDGYLTPITNKGQEHSTGHLTLQIDSGTSYPTNRISDSQPQSSRVVSGVVQTEVVESNNLDETYLNPVLTSVSYERIHVLHD